MKSIPKIDFIRKLFREKDIEKIDEKIKMLGSWVKFDALTFIFLRLVTTLLVLLLFTYILSVGYIFAPFVAIVYYYLFYYILIESKIKRRIKRLDKEALDFFEILTLTLESGRNLENALEITCFNIDSELSNEFKKTLFEMKFGKSLVESLDDMKKRIPSESINNIILNITQTSIFGSSILDTMYNQIEFLRDKQILEIKEQINKIPNKTTSITNTAATNPENIPAIEPEINIVATVIKNGNLPLQGTKQFVSIAINFSLGEFIILVPITAAALQPNPMHMVSACLPEVHAHLKHLSKLKAILGKNPKSSRIVNRGKNIAIGGSITEITHVTV